MKRLIVVSALILSPCALASFGEEDVPPTEPTDPYDDPVAIKYREDTAKFEQIIHNFKTLDVFAGAVNMINFREVTWIVDRSNEQRKIAPNPGTIAAGAAATGALVKDLKASLGGKVQVKFSYKTLDANGKVTGEVSFEVATEGTFQVDTGGFQEAQNKQHK